MNTMNTTRINGTTEKERQSKLQQYVADMMSVEGHIANAVERQLSEEHLADHNAEARRIIHNIQEHSRIHQKRLRDHLKTIGGDDSGSRVKDSLGAILGAAAGMIDKMRTEEVSKMLRDDYTALNLACISYTMLHTTGLAFNDRVVADLAQEHLQHYAEIVMDINKIMPHLVVEEFNHHDLSVDPNMAQKAEKNTQQAWQPSSS